MIIVHGYLGEPSPRLRADAARAALVVGGQRHLDALGVPEPKRVVLGKLDPAIAALKALGDDDLAVVVASGDPLFYGIGRRLRAEGLPMRVVPTATSVAAAFATVCLPWDDAAVVSAHGHDLAAAVDVCRTHPKVAVLTARDRGVRELAAALPERTFVLCERLGEADERVRTLTATEAATLSADDVAEPNVVLVLTDRPERLDTPASTPVAGEPALEVDPQDDEPRADAVVGHVVNSPASRVHADAIDQALGISSRRYEGSAKENLPRAWSECDLIISHLALGATTRLIAPLLADKKHDPGVVVVDEAGRFAVPLVGGHVGGANELARRVADALGATPVLTTATDALDIPALDQLGWPYAGDVAGVTQAIIDGREVIVERDHPWPLPPLPGNVRADVESPVARILLSDRAIDPPTDLPTVVLHPPSLVVGMGCNAGTPLEQLRAHFDATLAEAGLARESVVAVTTHQVKAGELGLVQLTAELGVPLLAYPPETLAVQAVPTPSATVNGHVGTPSVAEASVMARHAELVVKKHKSTEATCAIGRLPARGRLSVVGLGPGARDLLSPRAVAAIRNATYIVGYGPYVKQIRDLARAGTRVSPSKMGTEEERTADAIAHARAGENVALVCSGDPSMYAMASPVLEQGTEGIDVDIVPGITAALAASSILGAPLGHDNCTISLSDLHTRWEVIEQRLRAAADGDFVVSLYNPRSRTRRMHLPRALEILSERRPPSTPVGVVRQACRPQQSVQMSTLAEFDVEWVDMNSIVIVGSSRSRYVTTGSGELRIVTPRDYQWMEPSA